MEPARAGHGVIGEYSMKCKNCKHEEISVNRADEWYWCRCLFCGFHTSSYQTPEYAKEAWEAGEHYISENGNKIRKGPFGPSEDATKGGSCDGDML